MRQSRRKATWTALQPGDVVNLIRGGMECHKGVVDDRTEDGRTIWVIDQIGHRRMFHIEDDYDLTIPSAGAA
jgi:transcription elongation factor